MRYEWHLRADLRFDQHILAFYRAGSDRRIIAGYSAFRHGTRIGRSLNTTHWPPATLTPGRPAFCCCDASTAADCPPTRPRQHDGGHCDQSHTGYGPRTLIGPANPSKPMFHKAFHIIHSFPTRIHQMVANSVSQHVSHVVCRKLQTSQTSMHRPQPTIPHLTAPETSTLRSNARSSGSPCR